MRNPRATRVAVRLLAATAIAWLASGGQARAQTAVAEPAASPAGERPAKRKSTATIAQVRLTPKTPA
ncbi:MAG: hypothetical protein LW698_10830 [Planctomycetaceae bacterium]|nr:hypothetical protein [Planctomycetaceae bacterium]